jgi:hypothetical protein
MCPHSTIIDNSPQCTPETTAYIACLYRYSYMQQLYMRGATPESVPTATMITDATALQQRVPYS